MLDELLPKSLAVKLGPEIVCDMNMRPHFPMVVSYMQLANFPEDEMPFPNGMSDFPREEHMANTKLPFSM